MKLSMHPQFFMLATAMVAKPLFVTGESMNKPALISKERCTGPRKEIAESYIDCLNFSKNVQKNRINNCNKKNTKKWRRLSRDLPKKPAICTDETPFDAFIELVSVCQMASLDGDECKELASTLVDLSTKLDMSDQTHEGCSDETKVCPDGFTTVGRDPKNGCEYFPCPPIYCTQDVQLCPGFDDLWVGRDPDNNCNFYPCPPPEDENETVYKCPCSNYIQKVNEDNIQVGNSCKIQDGDDCDIPSSVGIWVDRGGEKYVFPIGSDAQIYEDNGEGFCAEGDAINVISVGEAKACAKEIVARCKAIGYPVCDDDDSN